VNSPLAEATILGTGVGLAACGWKPILELMFIDFIGPAFNQLIAQMSNLRWRTVGDWNCPLILYAPYGAYLPGAGMWHSQSNEALLAHIPGIRVVIPSDPGDAAGMFLSAYLSNDPTVILLPKHLLRVKSAVSEICRVPFGKAKTVRAGEDCTVVAWGNLVQEALNGAETLATEGISCEVIDLRSIMPWDRTAIVDSLGRTGRLVVAHEDNRTCGFGQAILTDVLSNPESFYKLLAPPQLVSRPDVHIPFNPELEDEMLPTSEGIAAAVRRTLRE
jgi:2-oxoisovalerate dehydrogenase E1 component